MRPSSRRSFLTTVPAVLAPVFVATRLHAWTDTLPSAEVAPSAWYPTQDPDLVREMVNVAHFDLARVTQLVTRQPALARAAWDWGFGDWEDALGAASHVGNHDIASFLLANGARPSIFSAAMLGQLDVVTAFVAASPGIQRTKGPHGITLLAHAINGGPRAAATVEYLKKLGDADQRIVNQPIAESELATLAGTYQFGPAADQRIEIAVTKGQLTFTRAGRTARGLTHVGGLAFAPAGAEAARIRFERAADGMVLTVQDPDPVLVARRAQTPYFAT